MFSLATSSAMLCCDLGPLPLAQWILRQLYWTRAITGIAIGGVLPVLFSILGDLVDTGKRTEASGAFGIAVGMGLGLGQVIT